jgi:hypothetical protein
MKKYIILLFLSIILFEAISQNNLSEFSNWPSYGVKKFEMGIPSSNNRWEEILIYNPSTELKIQNEKDIYINNLDLISFIVGQDKIGRIKGIVFKNGTSMNTTEPYTKRYSGQLKLIDNNGIESISGDAIIDFFYYPNNGKLGIVLIANKIGMTKARIWVSDTTGMRILK